MGIVIPAGYMQISFGGTIAGDSEQAVFTIGASEEGLGNPDMAEELYNAWSEAMEVVSSSDWMFRSVTAKHGPTATGETQEFVSGSIQGDVSQSALPINTAVLLRKLTGLGGKKGRGRAYLCGCAIEGISGGAGIIDPGALVALQDAVDAFHTAAEAVDGVGQFVLLHSDATAPNVLTGLQVQGKYATQRRRLRP